MAKPSKRPIDKDDKRTTILNAGRQLLLEKGAQAVTVSDIAREAAVSKGAVYLHFKSKEEIFAQILLTDLEEFYQSALRILHTGKSAAEMLQDYADIYVTAFVADREAFRKIMTFMLEIDHMVLPETLNKQLIQKGHQTINIVGTIIQRGMESGEFSFDLDIWQCRNVIWGMLNGILSLYLFSWKKDSREEVIRTLINTGIQSMISAMKSP